MTTAPLPLTGVVQHYAWGGFEFIPHLLGLENPERKPFAELWFGAHPSAPSLATVDGTMKRLDALIASNPSGLLGEASVRRFGNRFPFLLKVLDARQMLSIQAHPTKQQAEAGFARENAAGIPLGAPQRTYRDDNHKPEVHVALTEFWMLHGFRVMADVDDVLRAVPEFAPFLRILRQQTAAGTSDQQAVRDLYRLIMTLPQDEIDRVLDPLVDRLERESPSDRGHPDFWALRAARTFPLPHGQHDRGILSIYLLNLVHLRPGEGTYQPAGTLHAYLEGTNVELMANSDNVLRGGLTSKHVDVPELLGVVDFQCGRPEILGSPGGVTGETVYRTPAEEFELSRVTLPPQGTWCGASGQTAEVWVWIAGIGRVEISGGPVVDVRRGEALFLPPGPARTVRAGPTGLELFRAGIPTLQSESN